jgi:MerR family transcriptional regulator, copper efflux regulator
MKFPQENSIMSHLTIGKLAQRTTITKVAIRYYERLGLIPKPERRTSGYRLYSETTIDRITFIKNAKSVGFTLEEIKELLRLERHDHTTSQMIKSHTELKLDAIEKKIQCLQGMANTLMALTQSCDGKMPLQECPILKALHQKVLAVDDGVKR